MKRLLYRARHHPIGAANHPPAQTQEPAIESPASMLKERVSALLQKVMSSPRYDQRMQPIVNDIIQLECKFGNEKDGYDNSNRVKIDSLEELSLLMESGALGKHLAPILAELHSKLISAAIEAGKCFYARNFMESKRNVSTSLFWALKQLRRLSQAPEFSGTDAMLAEKATMRTDFGNIMFSYSILKSMLGNRNLDKLKESRNAFDNTFISITDAAKEAVKKAYRRQDPGQLYAWIERIAGSPNFGPDTVPALVMVLNDIGIGYSVAAKSMNPESATKAAASISELGLLINSPNYDRHAELALRNVAITGERMLASDTVNAMYSVFINKNLPEEARRTVFFISTKCPPKHLMRAYNAASRLFKIGKFQGRVGSAIASAASAIEDQDLADFLDSIANAVCSDPGIKPRMVAPLCSVILGCVHDEKTREECLGLFSKIANHKNMKGRMVRVLDMAASERGEDLYPALASLYSLINSNPFSNKFSVMAEKAASLAKEGAVSDSLDMLGIMLKNEMIGIRRLDRDLLSASCAIANHASLARHGGMRQGTVADALKKLGRGFSKEDLLWTAEALPSFK
jgi:hypothetical protein